MTVSTLAIPKWHGQSIMDEPALLEGRLMAVNWACGTAELHRRHGAVVPLCFGPALNDAVRGLTTQHVEIRGRGRFNAEDRWEVVCVEQITGTRSLSEPFDLEAFRNNPNPKIFDPDKVIALDLTQEEWESFNRAIREGRDEKKSRRDTNVGFFVEVLFFFSITFPERSCSRAQTTWRIRIG